MSATDGESVATVTSKGQITIPSEVRRALGLDVGDKVEFTPIKPGEFKIRVRKRRSIIDIARRHPLPRLDPPFRDEDIDDAVAAAMADRERRARGRKPAK